MAPEQGPDSKSICEKKGNTASDEGSDSINDSSKHDTLGKDSIGWIYLLRKEQLIEQCKNAGIPTTGFTVDHLRKKLAESLRSKKLRSSTENILRELEEEIKSSENSVIADEVISLTVPVNNTRNISDLDIMTTVQKWNLHFSGESDLMEFLERTEELAECHRISCDQLLPSMLGVLRGNALKWYRVKRNEIHNWTKFREEIQKFFLPKRYLAQIEQNFYNRKQNTRERAKDFILSMLTLARQHPLLRAQDHLDRIFDGLRSEYRYYIRRRDFTNLDELTALTDEFEALRREERPQTSHMVVTAKYRRGNTCWRCKRMGHHRRSCTFESRLFCSFCGKDGVLSRSCRCHTDQFVYKGKQTIHDSRCHTNQFVYKGKQSIHDSRYHIQVSVNELKINALLDTGATRTYISHRIARHLEKIGIKAKSGNGVVQLADQSLATHLNIFRIKISYEGKSIALECTEIPSLAEDVILGMDFLAAHDLELRLNGKVLPRAEVNEASSEALDAIMSREFLSEEENLRLNPLFDNHKSKFKQATTLCTVAEHEIILKHTRHHIKPKGIQPPTKHIPPPEARPGIIENVQITQPKTPPNPPPLRYSRRVTITDHEAKRKDKNQQSEQNKNHGIFTRPSAEEPSTSQDSVLTRTETKGKRGRDELFTGIVVHRPKRYRYHHQFVLNRENHPPVQITIMSRTRARLRCQGHEKFVEMESGGGREN